MINYDIHWNPVRLMQRIGRVDRRMDPVVEDRLVADHPEAGASRGKVWFARRGFRSASPVRKDEDDTVFAVAPDTKVIDGEDVHRSLDDWP